MAKLRFGVWISTYAWADDPGTPDSVRENTAKIRDSVLKCEEHGIDVWVIDHLLSAPGLYEIGRASCRERVYVLV